ncbi:MAG: S8 family peptidase [Hyphomicrobiales bacterium]
MAVARGNAIARRLAVVCAVAAAVLAAVIWRSGSAEAASMFMRALPATELNDHMAAEPTLVARKRKAGRKKRARRKVRKRRQHAKKHGQKPVTNKPKKQTADNTTPDKKPDVVTQTADNRPNKGPANPVCIGGRVNAGQCQCRRAGALRQIRRSVFGCVRGGKPVALPRLAKRSAVQSKGLAPELAGRAVAADRPKFVPDEVLVTMRRDTAESVDAAIARRFRLEVVSRTRLDLFGSRLVRFRIPDGRAVGRVVAALQGERRARAPQPNYYYYRQTGEVATLKAADLQYALAKVDVPSAHALARGRGVRIAVIDSGIDTTHPDLAGAVDRSFNASGRKRAKPSDHGTAIAGIIRARGLIQGIAPEAGLLSVNVFVSTGKGRPAAATTVSLLRGIDWALAKRARVLNMSLAGPHDPLLKRAITAAHGNRAIIVAAAGNGGTKAPPAYPAAYPEVIAVTATDAADRLYGSANRGGYIAVAAPGVDILAPALGHGHALKSGTSFAAAHVSGIIALMIERNSRLTSKQVRRTLARAARDLGPPGRDNQFGAGRADAFKSLALIR